jgi:hypothetical protein
MVGVIEPVTLEYDVAINVLRGQASHTFIYNVVDEWKKLGMKRNFSFFRIVMFI